MICELRDRGSCIFQRWRIAKWHVRVLKIARWKSYISVNGGDKPISCLTPHPLTSNVSRVFSNFHTHITNTHLIDVYCILPDQRHPAKMNSPAYFKKLRPFSHPLITWVLKLCATFLPLCATDCLYKVNTCYRGPPCLLWSLCMVGNWAWCTWTNHGNQTASSWPKPIQFLYLSSLRQGPCKEGSVTE